MAEKSYLWTTGGAGDGASTYTRDDWATISKVLGSAQGFEGVAPDLLNALAPTANGANTVAVNTGGALVDGKPYYNNASLNVNIPSAVGAGNTRIDRLVLRCDWTAQTVRITRIAGTDAASPSAPAITQTSGSTYDIKLCQVLVNTTGTVTVTDERVYTQSGTNSLTALAVTSAKLAANAVTAGKLADGAVDTTARLANDIVDDTKVGNRVPALIARQGGNATYWTTAGTTTYTPGPVRMQCGAVNVTILANQTSGSVAITFPVAFSSFPIVLATMYDTTFLTNAQINASSDTGATIVASFIGSTRGSNTTLNVFWLAIGPE